jgi:DNA invertase Pin-like site-specific DNA recombinase
MNGTPHHLERGAYLYVRQSSIRQVVENIESTKRQYGLRGRAIALGWRDDQIITIVGGGQGGSHFRGATGARVR